MDIFINYLFSTDEDEYKVKKKKIFLNFYLRQVRFHLMSLFLVQKPY